ncbi:MAG TPA: hypothetical protein VI386_12680 [Candidatus Sulfotelmatobacter sp.]
MLTEKSGSRVIMTAGCGTWKYFSFQDYIRRNPVKRGLAQLPEGFAYSSAAPGFQLDGLPPRLKPIGMGA